MSGPAGFISIACCLLRLRLQGLPLKGLQGSYRVQGWCEGRFRVGGRFTVDSKKFEYRCRRIYAGFLPR